MNLIPSFIRSAPGLAAFSVLAIAASGFGQTFFIAVFGSAIRDDFALSHTSYGLFYSGATLLAAIFLLRLGGIADCWRVHHVATLALFLLTIGCLLMGLANHVLLLIAGFFLLRLGGQGLMAHIGLTTAGRYFPLQRGKVVALTVSGFPLAEAILPVSAALLIASFGWRSAWFGGAVFLLLVLLPLFWLLSRDAASPAEVDVDQPEAPGKHYGRAEVLSDPAFYLLLPAALVTPFVVTGILFHQAALAEARGWSLTLFASAFTGYAAGHWLALLIAGPLVDRISATRTLPLSLMPMLLAMLLLAGFSAPWVPWVYLTLTGFTQGAMSASGGALWPERYGVRRLGAIRSMVQAVMIFATALAPVLVGALLDWQLGVAGVALLMAGATLVSAALALLVRAPGSSAT